MAINDNQNIINRHAGLLLWKTIQMLSVSKQNAIPWSFHQNQKDSTRNTEIIEIVNETRFIKFKIK